MTSKEIVLSDREEAFIQILLDNGGKVHEAAVEAGYSSKYDAYKIRRRLAEQIAIATQQYLAYHAPKAAKALINTLDEETPNPTRLSAANAVLDKAGVAKPEREKDIVAGPTIKANIFILPEKRPIDAIEAAFEVIPQLVAVNDKP